MQSGMARTQGCRGGDSITVVLVDGAAGRPWWTVTTGVDDVVGVDVSRWRWGSTKRAARGEGARMLVLRRLVAFCRGGADMR